MSNHKAHFRGDIQVDGSIVGPDGQPVGGSVDVSGLLPVDGSRAMTAPIHFAGGDNGEAFGPNLGWDEDNFGLLLSPQPGHSRNDNFADIYLVAEGDTARSGIDISVAEAYSPYLQLDYTPASGFGYSGILNAVGMSVDRSEVVSGYVDASVWLSPGSLGETMFQLSQPGDRDFITLKQLIDNNYRFEIDADAAIHWGGGSAAPDVSLTRTGPGSMEFTNPSGTYGTPGLSMFGAGSGLYAHDDADWTNYSALTPNHLLVSGVDGSVTILQDGFSLYNVADGGFTTLVSHPAEGVLELLNGGSESASALRLHSPDGTAYDIKVANGGALSAVAA